MIRKKPNASKEEKKVEKVDAEPQEAPKSRFQKEEAPKGRFQKKDSDSSEEEEEKKQPQIVQEKKLNSVKIVKEEKKKDSDSESDDDKKVKPKTEIKKQPPKGKAASDSSDSDDDKDAAKKKQDSLAKKNAEAKPKEVKKKDSDSEDDSDEEEAPPKKDVKPVPKEIKKKEKDSDSEDSEEDKPEVKKNQAKSPVEKKKVKEDSSSSSEDDDDLINDKFPLKDIAVEELNECDIKGFKGLRKIIKGSIQERELLAVSYAFFERLFSSLTPGNYLEKLKEKGQWEIIFPLIQKSNAQQELKWIEKIKNTPFTSQMAKDFQKDFFMCVAKAFLFNPQIRKEISKSKLELKQTHWEEIAKIIKSSINLYKKDGEPIKIISKELILSEPLNICIDDEFCGIYYKQEQAAILAEDEKIRENCQPKEPEEEEEVKTKNAAISGTQTQKYGEIYRLFDNIEIEELKYEEIMDFKGLRKINKGNATGRIIFAAIYAFYERLFSSLSDRKYIDGLKDGSNFWTDNFPDINKRNNKQTLNWIEQIKKTPLTNADAMKFKVNMGNCIINAFQNYKELKDSYNNSIHEPSANDWKLIATCLNCDIIVYENGKEKFKSRVLKSILQEPLSIMISKEFSGILYTAKQALVFAESETEKNKINASLNPTSPPMPEQNVKPPTPPTQQKRFSPPTSSNSDPNWEEMYKVEEKKTMKLTETLDVCLISYGDLLSSNTKLIETIYNVGKKRDADILPQAIKELGSKLSLVPPSLKEFDTNHKIKEKIDSCATVCRSVDTSLKGTMDIIKNGLKPQQPAPMPVVNDKVNIKEEVKVQEKGTCINCKAIKDIVYKHNDKCKYCLNCIKRLLNEANNLDQVLCSCKVIIPEPVLSNLDKKLTDIVKSKEWGGQPPPAPKEEKKLESGKCEKCNKDVQCVMLECSHKMCTSCVKDIVEKATKDKSEKNVVCYKCNKAIAIKCLQIACAKEANGYSNMLSEKAIEQMLKGHH